MPQNNRMQLITREQPESRPRALWSCPRCRLKFVTRNLWHSCGQATRDDWKGKMGPQALALYERFEYLIERCGRYHVSPAKTRITFLGRVRFAGITRLSEDGLRCNFALPHALRSRRFVKVSEVVPGWWSHELQISEPRELDAEVQGWLRQSYRLMGMQHRLKPKSRGKQERTRG
jgi:hypothetical protein